MDAATNWSIGIALVVIVLGFLIATRGRDRSPLGFTSRRLPVLPAVSLTAADLTELRETNEQAGKIQAIKRLREMRALSLADAKKVIDVLDGGGTIPVSSGEPTAPGWADTASGPDRTGTLADRARLLRDQAGAISAIKYVREQTGMGLAEAKSFVDALR